MPFFQPNEQLEALGAAILGKTWNQFPQLAPNQIALTWIVYDSPVIVNTGGAIAAEEFWQYPVRGFSYRGVETFEPGELVQLFYLVALQDWLETNMINNSPEIDRALRNMTTHSSHDATSLIVDILSGTTSGPQLAPEPFSTWQYQRNIVNRYYQSLGWEELKGTNINQKTWSEGYYGRERDFVGPMLENCNRLTAHGIARLFHSIIGGVAVSRARSQAMMHLLHRHLPTSHSYIASTLPPQSQLWSKTGQTPIGYHEAAYIEIPQLSPYLLILVTQSQDPPQNQDLLPFLAQSILQAMPEVSPSSQ
ncbi:serine hydrolase [Spirulina sp. CS-785/01]|uniref:serine hydrolase n=1 Tax=Spirulina sp. CS-785/01 TaxID=3021716 RepID=UPI002330BA1A|nr:serine hydrolase [Spirulina sp. CS-785/01]MDB9311508.1 serine hydrolase [Spirulina sp. CS-785/01]